MSSIAMHHVPLRNDFKGLQLIYTKNGQPIDPSTIDRYGFLENVCTGCSNYAKSFLYGSQRRGKKELFKRQIEWYMVHGKNIKHPLLPANLLELLKIMEMSLGKKRPLETIPAAVIAEIITAFDGHPKALARFFARKQHFEKALGSLETMDYNYLRSQLEQGVNSTQAIIARYKAREYLGTKIVNNFKTNIPFEFSLAILNHCLTIIPYFGVIPFQLCTINSLGDIAVRWPGVVALSLGLALMLMFAQGIANGTDAMLKDGPQGFGRGFKATWQSMVDNELTYHPLLESTLLGIYVSVTWAYAATYMKAFEGLTGFGFGHKVLYPILNLILTLQDAMHRGTLLTKDTVKNCLQGILTGAFRGFIKDSLKLTNAVSLSEEEAAKLLSANRMAGGIQDATITIISALCEDILKHFIRMLRSFGISEALYSMTLTAQGIALKED